MMTTKVATTSLHGTPWLTAGSNRSCKSTAWGSIRHQLTTNSTAPPNAIMMTIHNSDSADTPHIRDRLTEVDLEISRTTTEPLVDDATRRAGRSYWRVGLGIAASVLALVVFWPLLAGSFYLSRAGYVLATVPATGATAAFERAITDLLQAQQYLPDEPLVYRQLANALERVGRRSEAVAYRERAYSLLPESLLLRLELAHSYERSDRVTDASSHWVDLGVTPAQMAVAGDANFAQHAYAEALDWYRCAEASGIKLSDNARFWRMIAAIAVGSPETKRLVANWRETNPEFEPVPLEASGRVLGKQFYLITPFPDIYVPAGMPIAAAFAQTGNSPLIDEGLLWRTSEAVAIIDPAVPGKYLVRATMQLRGPPLAEYQLLVDGHPVYRGVLNSATERVTIEVPVQFEARLHSVHLQFLNEFVVEGGLDRGLIIHDVAFVRL